MINDSYRGELCLLYPPYLIAIAALYLSVLLHGNTRQRLSESFEDPATIRRTTRSAGPGPVVSTRDRLLDFLAGLNVSLETISRICQHMLSMYALWDILTDGTDGDEKRRHDRKAPGLATGLIPLGDRRNVYTEKALVEKLMQMRERRESDLAHPADARPPDNKLMEKV